MAGFNHTLAVTLKARWTRICYVCNREETILLPVKLANLPVLVLKKDLRFTAAETKVSFFSEVSGSHIETHGIPCLTAQAIVH